MIAYVFEYIWQMGLRWSQEGKHKSGYDFLQYIEHRFHKYLGTDLRISDSGMLCRRHIHYWPHIRVDIVAVTQYNWAGTNTPLDYLHLYIDYWAHKGMANTG